MKRGRSRQRLVPGLGRKGERIYALGTASQIRKALKGKPGFVQCHVVERGIVCIIHTLDHRTRFPSFRQRLFWWLGEARMARDNWTPTKKHRRVYTNQPVGYKIPREYQVR